MILRFIRVQLVLLSPICPHYCDYIWTNLWLKHANTEGKEPQSILQVLWPEGGVVDDNVTLLVKKSAYLEANIHEWRLRALFLTERSFPADHLVVYIAEGWPAWQKKALLALESLYQKETNDFPSDYKSKIAALFKDDQTMKRNMLNKLFGVLENIVEKVREEGPNAMSVEVPFDEKSFLQEQDSHIKNAIPAIKQIDFHLASDTTALGPEAKRATSVPMKPSFHFAGEPDPSHFKGTGKTKVGQGKKSAGQ